ncbi:MAG: D-alanyl-D-alanine carboxypeptidase/D-alanyl-D-alanine endopeptidase [Bradymonadia bacterium]
MVTETRILIRMRNVLISHILLFFFLVPISAFSQKNSLSKANFKAQIVNAQKALQQKSLKDVQVSVLITNTMSGEVIFEKNADLPLHPASNTKVITTAAALELLGSGYSWNTFLKAGKLNKGRAKDIYLVGQGDPRFVSESLWKLIDDARRNHNLKRIDGNLYVDDTYFTQDTMAPGFNDKNQDAAYRAASGAMSINFNSIKIKILPSSKVDKAPIVEVWPTREHVFIRNEARTTQAGKERLGLTASAHKDKTKLHLTGRIPVGHRGLVVRRRIDNPALFAGDATKHFLKNAGIRFKGKVLKKKHPRKAVNLAKIRSRTLGLIIQDINKLSNNFMAEQVLRTIGLVHGGVGDWIHGTKVVSKYLKDKLNFTKFKYVNGSGLFGDTRFSARQMVAVLDRMASSPLIRPEFFSSLALSRQDGTLKKRFRKLPPGTIRAKTGTLRGVICLSGYIHHESGELLTFSILMNDLPGKGWIAFRIQDQILNAFSGYSTESKK